MKLHVVEIEKEHPRLRKDTPGPFTKDDMNMIAHHFNCHEKLVKLLKDAQRYIRAKDPKYIEIEQALKQVEKA